jgi:hypothetical protein
MEKFKKFLPLIGILSVGLFFTPDILSMLTYVYRFSVVGILTVISLWVVGEVNNWGLFTNIDIKELVEKAKQESIGAAVLFASIIYYITVVINAVVGK